MVLGIFDAIDDFFSSIEDLVTKHFDNPILWIAIVLVLLLIVACAYNSLSK